MQPHLRLPVTLLAAAAFALQCTLPPAYAQTPPDSATMVNALNGVFGAHPRFRANHAHGMLLTGVFYPAAEGAALTRAPHFSGAPTPVLLRFSNFGGNPDVADADADAAAAPYGMSIKFMLEQDLETDLIMHSFNGFPSATTADFVDFLVAMGKSPAGSARPTALDRYAQTHPAAQAFLNAPKPAPLSFTSQPYFGVNTFTFTNAAGRVSHGRYRVAPLTAARYLDTVHQTGAGADYLRSEIRDRLAAGPVPMRLLLQIAAPEDELDDPSIAWPETRTLAELGTLLITAVVEHGETAERTVVFSPDELPDGIEAHDPMIGARTRAYAESLERRLR